MSELKRAIDVAEEFSFKSFHEARYDLKVLQEKVHEYDLLWERAHTVIALFERLGKTRNVAEQMTLHRSCETAMLALKDALKLEEPDQ